MHAVHFEPCKPCGRLSTCTQMQVQLYVKLCVKLYVKLYLDAAVGA